MMKCCTGRGMFAGTLAAVTACTPASGSRVSEQRLADPCRACPASSFSLTSPVSSCSGSFLNSHAPPVSPGAPSCQRASPFSLRVTGRLLRPAGRLRALRNPTAKEDRT